MATRSIIAVEGREGYGVLHNGAEVVRVTKSDKEWFGRYCHWDGSPDTMIPALEKLIDIWGVEIAKSFLMNNHWSSIGGTMDKCVKTDWSEKDDPYLYEIGEWDTEYVYLICSNGTVQNIVEK
jgi:hypothetical protein